MNNQRNENKQKRVIRTYFVWSEKKEARWLSEMSSRGWHLKKASPFFYTFEKGEPRDLVYQFDFRFRSSGDEEEYLDIFREAGWERVCRVGGWHYFRKVPKDGEQNRIYSDRESLRKKYRNLLLFLFIVGLPLLLNFFSIFRFNDLSPFYRWFWPVNTLFLLMWLYALVRISLYMGKGKPDDGE